MSLELAAIAYRERKNQPSAFDGVWRPEPWLSEKDWRAVWYGWTGAIYGRRMDYASFEDEAGAQTRCDVLNATREGVSAPRDGQGRLI